MKKRSILVIGLLVVIVFTTISIQVNARLVLGMTIKGTITDSENGTAIPNAKVSLIVDGVTNGYTYSESDGKYEISYQGSLLLGPIPGLLKVEKSGYYTEWVSTTIPAFRQTPTIEDISLTQIPITYYSYTVRGSVKSDYGIKLNEAAVVLTGYGKIDQQITTITGYYSLTLTFTTSGSKTFILNCSRDDYLLYSTAVTLNPGTVTRDISLEEDPSCHSTVSINPNLFAIIVAGMGEDRFTRDALGMYDTLSTYYGLSDDNAILITPHDTIDGKNVPRDYETSKFSINSGFSYLAGNVDSDDIVIVWWTGHGDPDKFLICDDDFSFSQEYEYLYVYTAEEMVNRLDAINCEEMYIFLGPCQSGSFIDDLNVEENRAIYTSCLSNGTGFVLDGHSLFPFATYRGLHPYLGHAVADTNNNGNVSLSELFVYCEDFIALSLAPYGNTQYPQYWPDTGVDESNTYIGLFY